MTEPFVASTAGLSRPAWIVLLAAAAGEMGLLAAGLVGWLSALPLLAGHLCLVGGMAVALRESLATGRDGGVALLALLVTFATGPFGAVGALLLPRLTRRNPRTEARLGGWYRRVALSAEQDELTQLSDRVAIGRAADLAAPPPQAFAALFRSGAVAEQQTALGLIARAFHPGYLPVLKIALDSAEPLIRVQAAAVAARIRGQLNDQVAALCMRAADPGLSTSDAAEAASDLTWAMTSGLLDEEMRIDAAAARTSVLARNFARLDAVPGSALSPGVALRAERPSAAAAEAYAAELLAQGRFADFRARRMSFRRPLHGRYRHRLVVARPLAWQMQGQLAPLTVRR